MRARSALPALAFLLLASCTKSTEPTYTVLESFDLVSIDGDPVPAKAGTEQNTNEIHPTAELFEIRDNDRVGLRLDYIVVLLDPTTFTPIASLPERRRRESFYFHIYGDSIRVYDEMGCVIDACTIARGTKIGDDLTLIRPQWSGSRIFLYTRTPAAP